MASMSSRKAVPLTDTELAAVEQARDTLVEIAGESAGRSEAAALHALVLLGLDRVREHSTEKGYAALAASQDDEDRAYAQAVRGRRRGGTDDE